MYIYVAGPYSSPDPVENTRQAILIADILLEQGHTPFVPHLNAFWHLIRHHSYETWMRWCLQWVRRSDAVFRIPGASPGADREVVYAAALGKPVFLTMDDVPPAREEGVPQEDDAVRGSFYGSRDDYNKEAAGCRHQEEEDNQREEGGDSSA